MRPRRPSPGSSPTGPRPARRRVRALAPWPLVLGAAQAFAQGGALDSQQSIAVGEAALYPSLRVDYRYDDNIGLRSDDEVDGSAVVLRPRLDFVADRRQLELRAAYAGEFSRGSEGPLDYVDHELGVELDAEFDARRRVSLAVGVARRSEALGLELTRGVGGQFDEPILFNDSDLEGTFTFGARDARGNIVLGARASDASYVNLPEITDGRDYTRLGPFARFSYRLSSDTRAFVEARYDGYDFERDRDDRDELGVGAGLTFSATGKLRGFFRVGAANASYGAPDVEDETLLTAGATLAWLPREYATISLDLGREFDNLSPTTTVAGEGQSVRTNVRLGWAHQWSDRFRSELFGRYTNVERACPDLPTDVVAAGAELGLSVRRWLELGASAGVASRTADDCPGGADAEQLDFDNAQLGVFVRATL